MKSFSLSSLIGYLIGGVFVVLILLAPIGATSYLVYDLTKALLNYESDTAEIVRCESTRQTTDSRVRYKRVPVAITAQGITVKGDMDEIRWVYKCNDLIGEQVKVLIDPKDSKNGKINSFFQMWFLPLLFILISIIYYPFVIKGYIKKYKNKKIVNENK